MSLLGIARDVMHCSTLPSDNTAITRSVWQPRSFGSYLRFFVDRYLQENQALVCEAKPSSSMDCIKLSLVHGYLCKKESNKELKVS